MCISSSSSSHACTCTQTETWRMKRIQIVSSTSRIWLYVNVTENNIVMQFFLLWRSCIIIRVMEMGSCIIIRIMEIGRVQKSSLISSNLCSKKISLNLNNEKTAPKRAWVAHCRDAKQTRNCNASSKLWRL